MARAKRRRSLGNAQHRQVQARLDVRDTLGWGVKLIVQNMGRQEKAFDRALRAKDCRQAGRALREMKTNLRVLRSNQVEAARHGVVSTRLQELERHFRNLTRDAADGFTHRCAR